MSESVERRVEIMTRLRLPNRIRDLLSKRLCLITHEKRRGTNV